jgi:tripartite-type tricarboxylate transporter receptor subunit TctC
MTKRTGLRVLTALGLCAVGLSYAQSYPAKPVRILIGYGPGGAADFTARVIGQKLQAPQQLGQPVIVESRPGAGSTIAIRALASAPPDGYTLMVLSEGGIVQSARGTKLGYDIDRDIAPIALAANGPYALTVHPSVPARTAKELVALARQRPGQLNYGSSGNGSAQHLAGELFQMIMNVKLTHVPYKGGAQAAVATASGEVDMSFTTVPSALPLLQSAKVRLIGISSRERVSFMPNAPTLHELGIPYEYTAWYGVIAPANLSPEILTRLNAEIRSAVSSQDVKEAFNKGGLEATSGTPEQFRVFLRGQFERAAKLAKAAGLPSD